MRRLLAAAVALAAAGTWLARRTLRRLPATETYRFTAEQRVAAPLSEAFLFFEDPANLARLTPPGMRFEILHVEGLPMRAGTTMEYRIRILGLAQRWRTLITAYDPGRRFVDVQTNGPYAFWRHEHAFEAAGEETVMRDTVEYRLPYGPLGALANRLIVARQLRGIFAYRSQAITGIFGAARAS